MSRVHYFCDGYLLDDGGPNRQSTWVCMFNLSERDAQMRFTFYYEESEPTTMQYQMAPLSGRNMHLLACDEVRRNERFGARIECSEPMVLQITTGYYGVEDMEDWYTRGMHSVICADRLAKTNYYADGLVLDNEGVRLKEPEWAFILNPNESPASVVLHAYYGDGNHVEYAFTVAPQRVLPVFMDDLVVKNALFGARYVSNVPVAVQQTRLIEEEDRATIRSCYSVMAKPGPLPWQDESELAV